MRRSAVSACRRRKEANGLPRPRIAGHDCAARSQPQRAYRGGNRRATLNPKSHSEQIAARLDRYAAETQKTAAASMFGDVVMPADVLRTTLRKDGATEPESPLRV